MHAAIQWAVCETLGGVIFLSNFGVESRFLGVVRDMEIKFLRPATTALVSETSVDDGEIESVRRSLESTGKADFTLSISLSDSNGAKVAVAEASYHIRDRSLFRGLQSAG